MTWYYLPLSHAEVIPLHEPGLRKMAEGAYTVAKGEWAGYHALVEDRLAYTWKHYEIIKKFGRYPHRNAVMWRESTEEEKKYLEDGGETFGG
jgi:uncharacterized protein (DUF924 family)